MRRPRNQSFSELGLAGFLEPSGMLASVCEEYPPQNFPGNFQRSRIVPEAFDSVQGTGRCPAIIDYMHTTARLNLGSNDGCLFRLHNSRAEHSRGDSTLVRATDWEAK